MPAREVRVWLDRLVTGLANLALARARAGIPSSTLRKALTVRRPSRTKAVLWIPHYWAQFYHDGTAPVRDTMMIWFKDPRLDPRLSSGYPITRKQIRRLTADQFKKARDAGLLVIAYNRKAIPGRPFFDNDGNMRQFVQDAVKSIPPFFDTLIDQEFRQYGVGSGYPLVI